MDLTEDMIKTLRPMFEELAEAQSESLALVVAAIAKQIDAERLAADLRSQLKAAIATGMVQKLSVRLATAALAAADAEVLLRRQDMAPPAAH